MKEIKLVGFAAVNNHKLVLTGGNGPWKIFEFSMETEKGAEKTSEDAEDMSKEARKQEMEVLKEEIRKSYGGAEIHISDYLCDCREVFNDEFVSLSVYYGIMELPAALNGVKSFARDELPPFWEISKGTREAIDVLTKTLNRF